MGQKLQNFMNIWKTGASQKRAHMTKHFQEVFLKGEMIFWLQKTDVIVVIIKTFPLYRWENIFIKI